MAIKCPKCHSENPEAKQFCADCGTQLPQSQGHAQGLTETIQTPVRELTTGSIFAGRYQVIEELGQGGMGKVYKVFDTKINERVALKLIKPEIASERETLERFSNEMKLARKIGHRNVCRMFDLGEAGGQHFLTMEYVSGEDLKNMVRMSGTLSIGAVLSLGKQVADGLAEAHRLGVVHRDLKPQNVMIDKGGNAKIMDFGIARSIREKGVTGPGIMVGTPEYMSPEQAEAKATDERSDIYSLGIILYEMVTGRVPFEGETALSIAMKHKGEMPKNPKLLNPAVPDDLSEVILKCLAKDKEKRYQTASDLRSELDKIEKGIPTIERVFPALKPSTSREVTVKFNLRKIIAPALIVAVVVLAAIVYWLIAPEKRAPSTQAQKRSIAVLPFTDLSQSKQYEYLCDGLSETLIDALIHIEELWVPARTSAFFFKGKTQDVREIGQKLGVDNVLEGSVQVAGENLRVTARVSSAQDGRQVWSEIYDRRLADIFSIQDEIARGIVAALKVRLLSKQSAPIVRRTTADREAYDLYMQGIYFYNKRGRENLIRAVEYFREAIKRDPGYALAYAQLAETYQTIGMWGILPPTEAFPAAAEAASRALGIDSRLAEAHSAAAMVKFAYDWDWASSEKEFKLAIALNPNYAIAHKSYGQLLDYAGRYDEALLEFGRARELDPLSPIILCLNGFPLRNIGRYDEAIKIFSNALEIDPSFEPAKGYLHYALLWKYLRIGAYEEALQECHQVSDRVGLGFVYAKIRRPDETRKILGELLAQADQDPDISISISVLCFALEDRDGGFAWLEKAYANRHRSMCGLKNNRFFDSVRDDPRFKAVMKRVGLEN